MPPAFAAGDLLPQDGRELEIGRQRPGAVDHGTVIPVLPCRHKHGWEAWQSIKGGQWHARLIGSIPIVMVHDDHLEGLSTQVRTLEATTLPQAVPGT